MFLAAARSIVVITLLASGIACGGATRDRASSGGSAAVAVDDLGDTVRVGAPAQRIVSLSPVTTEALFALGAGPRLVGRTHWDTYPEAARAVPDLGNGMQPNVEAILGARPDLVVIYASEGNRSAARQLRAAGIATISIRTDHIADLRRVLTWLGRAVGDTVAARVVADSVERSIAEVRALPRPARAPTVFWHIWDRPLMTVGRGSFLHELVEAAGAVNIFGDRPLAAPQVTMEDLVARDPDLVVAGPTTAKEIVASPLWRAVRAVREGRVRVIDTTLVGRPGVRMGEAAHHLRTLLVDTTGR